MTGSMAISSASVRRCGHKHGAHGVLDGWGLGRVRHGDCQGRGVNSANNRTDERDNGVCNAYCAHQDATIPAINTVIAGAHECSGLVVHYTFGKVDTRERAFNRMRAIKSIYSTYLSYSLASSGESVPSFAFSASSSRRAWNSGLGFGSSAKCLATSGVKPWIRWSTNLPSVVSTDRLMILIRLGCWRRPGTARGCR